MMKIQREATTVLFVAMMFVLVGAAMAAEPSQPAFHHVHLNSTDPGRAVDFYTTTFKVSEKASLAGFDGVRSENMYLLFNRVSRAPILEPLSAIWHFGWGSTSMEADYRRHLENGVAFKTPITRLNPSLQFAYMNAPDGALVEINTANTNTFIHVHLYSEAPLCTADWYVGHLGATSRSAPRTGPCEVPFAAPSEPLGVIRSPVATVKFGEVSLIIYPKQKPGNLVSPLGHVVDHIALAVDDLSTLIERLKKSGVKVLKTPYRFGNSNRRAALIEGPDSIAIELIEKE